MYISPRNRLEYITPFTFYFMVERKSITDVFIIVVFKLQTQTISYYILQRFWISLIFYIIFLQKYGCEQVALFERLAHQKTFIFLIILFLKLLTTLYNFCFISELKYPNFIIVQQIHKMKNLFVLLLVMIILSMVQSLNFLKKVGSKVVSIAKNPTVQGVVKAGFNVLTG